MEGDGDGIEVKKKKVSVNIRCFNGKKFSVNVSLDSSVESFKSVVAISCDIPAEYQRLIYKGRILKDDHQTLKSYGLEAEHTVHLVRGFVPDGASNNSTGTVTTGPNITPPSVAEGTMGGMSGARLPDLEQMLRLRQAIRDDLTNSPFMRSNPQNFNPDFLQRLEAQRESELRSEVRRNIGSSPETVDALMRMFENVQETFPIPTMGSAADSSNVDPSSNPFAAFLGGAQVRHDQLNNPTTTAGSETTAGSPAPNTNPLPNPWAAGGAGTNETNATATHPEPNEMSQLLQNPAISRSMQGGLLSNPQYMNQMLGMNLQMLNPHSTEMMQNPGFIRHMTPETMQQMMALQQSSLSQLGRQQSSGDVDQTGGGTVPPEERFATQLAQLQEMGFFDARENLQALAATAGNVQAAVERLLGNLGQ